jgi:hypothetical protein
MAPNPLDVQELIERCICFVGEDTNWWGRRLNLMSCALVARSWVAAAQCHLFRAPPLVAVSIAGPYWDMGQNGPLLRLHNVLEASPHRYVRELSLRHTDGYSTDLATFRKVSNFPFIHLESFSIEISERQQLSDGYSSGLRRLFGLPTLVYLKLDIVIHEFSAFLEIWGGFSPSIRHVELTARLSFEDEPELDNPVVTPNPIQLDSLQVTLSHSNPLSDHFGMYRWALGPFDLSHLRALSIRDDAGVPWERFASQTIQLLDVDARVRINFICIYIDSVH